MPDTYENGQTVVLALFGWIPRFLWPGKPERGSSEFLTKHSGKVVAEGSSFGAGPIFEFYANFGYIGVFFGFVVLGVGVRSLDIAANNNLTNGRMDRFVRYFLLGLTMLQPLADLFFTVTALGAALVLSLGLQFFGKKLYAKVKT
jgi:hypothetical protein